jgi:hypothetical protein
MRTRSARAYCPDQICRAKSVNGGQTHTRPEVRGGTRRRAGRPTGSGRYSELTVTVRIPVSLTEQVAALVLAAGRKLPLIAVRKPSEAAVIGP